jgi:hypothetical protein
MSGEQATQFGWHPASRLTVHFAHIPQEKPMKVKTNIRAGQGKPATAGLDSSSTTSTSSSTSTGGGSGGGSAVLHGSELQAAQAAAAAAAAAAYYAANPTLYARCVGV